MTALSVTLQPPKSRHIKRVNALHIGMKIQIRLESNQLNKVLIQLFSRSQRVQLEIDSSDRFIPSQSPTLVELEVLMRPA